MYASSAKAVRQDDSCQDHDHKSRGCCSDEDIDKEAPEDDVEADDEVDVDVDGGDVVGEGGVREDCGCRVVSTTLTGTAMTEGSEEGEGGEEGRTDTG